MKIVGAFFIVIAVVIAAFPCQADSSERSVVLRPYIGMEYMMLDLVGLNISQGYGSEPTSPKGLVANIGGQLQALVGEWMIVKVGGAFTVFDSDFRDGFSDRRDWNPPRWGETYTYSRVSKIDPRYWVSLAWRKSGDNYFHEKQKSELGIKFTHLGLTIEQGLDAWNTQQPKQSYSGSGQALSFYYQHNSLIYELGPIFTFDIGKGKSVRSKMSLSAGIAF